MKDIDNVILEYFDLTGSNIETANNYQDYSDTWDESDWSDEPKSGCWGDW